MTKRPPQQSIHRAIDILEALEQASDGMGVTALSNQLGLKVGTTHNILKALKLRGFVTQPPGSLSYTLGPRLVALANNAAFQQAQLLRIATTKAAPPVHQGDGLSCCPTAYSIDKLGPLGEYTPDHHTPALQAPWYGPSLYSDGQGAHR